MLTMLLHRDRARSFYRVEISYNLFDEYSVLREWGQRGRCRGTRLNWFANLRDAVQAADHWRDTAQSRGYHLTERQAGRG